MATKYTMGLDQAQQYLNDPFTEAQPIDETGLNAHFRSTFDPVQPGGTVDPAAVPGIADSKQQQSSTTSPKASHSRNASRELKSRSRGNSLNQRFPGDKSHQPLDMLKQEAKKAHKSPHLRKGSIPGVDTIDALDSTPGGKYHHEGPYDATLASRNQDRRHSPVAATFDTTTKTLRATPPENIRNALDKHYPLDGVAQIPPGGQDRAGRTYDYDEMNMQTEAGGDYKKFPGENLNYDQERALQKKSERNDLANANAYDRDATGIELAEHSPKKKHVEITEHEVDDGEEGSHKHHALDGLKKRIGSLRKKHD